LICFKVVPENSRIELVDVVGRVLHAQHVSGLEGELSLQAFENGL